MGLQLDNVVTRHGINLASKRFLAAAAALSVTAAAIRLVLIAWVPTAPTSDFWSYFQRASSLADTGTYEAIEGRADATFPPGYPLLLAPPFSQTSSRLVTAKVINATLAGLSVLLMAFLGRRLAGDTIGVVAAAILTFYPRAAMTPLLVASENLFLPLLLGYLLLLLNNRDRRSATIALLSAGAISGLLTLTRSIAYPLWLLWPLPSIGTGLPKSRILKDALVVGVVANAVLLPWALRNRQALGVFTPFTSTSGQDLFIGNNANAPGYWYPFTGDIEAADPGWAQRGVMDRDRVAGQVALEWIASHPIDALVLYAKKWGLMLRDETFVAFFAVYGQNVEPPWPGINVLEGPHPLKDSAPSLDRALNYPYVTLSLLEVAGLLLLLLFPSTVGTDRSVRPKALLLAAVGLFFPLSAAAFHVSSRYRWPLTDSWIPFAAVALVAAATLVRHRFYSDPNGFGHA